MLSNSRSIVIILILFSMSLVTVSAADENMQLDMKNTATPLTNLVTGGQPSIEDLERLAASGTKVVINLRTQGEFKKFNEKKVVEGLGMKYVLIEVDGSDGINLENAKTLDAALNNLSEPVLVHCASSNRVGGLFAYRAFELQGLSAEKSLSIGKSAGMRSTEKKVKALISAKEK